MPSPPIQVFLTTIASQPALRQRQEYVLRVLQVKKAQFTSYDLASDEDAKKLWRRKAPLDKQQLPGLLIGGEFPGTFQEFEEAVEFGELDQFLRLNENWEPLEDDKPLLRAVPVGIPGAYAPAQMNPEHISPAPSPIKSKPPRRDGEIDAGDKLGDAGLSGVNVTEDDLLKLVEELGLDEASANDLVKGLTGDDTAAKKDALAPPAKEEPAAPAKEEAAAPAKEELAVPVKEQSAAPVKEGLALAEPPAVPAKEETAVKTEEPKPEVKVEETNVTEKPDEQPQEPTKAEEKAESAAAEKQEA
ncbi:hypothetical protein L227DRAFT_571434 [Lentinus tigrinus ALCF2SS1-6]|uniref:Uncharacterized protein n=1 Tax=Lentinus tigrinus ALCF2SS1-6 TaxID=1328759 RepID=A0A5C2SMW1_9APHY|nr:hypothetical protein L227DRAFT_571434 [Lentinus tigrinus ALCF2SS1-6]